MKCFLSVAKYLNLSLASKEMFISQPAMSQKINLIEEDLGVKLLIRSRQKVELTETGKYVQKEFSYMLDYYEKLKIQAEKIHNGNNHLSIGYHGPGEWANINDIIQEFHKKYPHIDVDVTIGGWGPLTMDLINGRISVLFVEKSEIEDITVLDSEFLFRDYTAVAISKSNPLAKYKKLKPKLLKNEKIIMSNNKSALKSLKQIIERLDAIGFDMQNAKMVDKYEITIAMASAGLGIAPIPRSFKIKGHNSVKYLDVDSDLVYQDFVLTWVKSNTSPSIKLFRDYCKGLNLQI